MKGNAGKDSGRAENRMDKHKDKDNLSKKAEEGQDDKIIEVRISELKAMEQKQKELEDMLKRLQAEYENHRKWTQKENAMICRNANLQLVKDLLPVLDSFQKAIEKKGQQEETSVQGHDGIGLIYRQIMSVLEKQGLRPINAVGEKFDPYRHEVLMQSAGKEEEGTITQEFQKGYFFNDVVIRHSKVMVCKGNDAKGGSCKNDAGKDD